MVQEVQDLPFGQQLEERAINLIDTLAAQLGVAAEHVYKVLSAQMFMEGVMSLITIALAVVLLSVLAHTTAKRWKVYQAIVKANERQTTEGEDIVLTIAVTFTILLTVVVVISVFLSGPHAIMKLLNPEYYVIKELLTIL